MNLSLLADPLNNSSRQVTAVEPESLVRFEQVSKTYDERSWVVDNLNLTIFKGEFLSLLGPSGSGKTTALMMLGGFEQADRGKIMMDGLDISKVPPRKRDMGIVFQNYALFPHMSIEENIAFPLRVRKLPDQECRQRVKEALDMVQLSHTAKRKPSQLSGGQQQRIALARALVYRPRLLLMDEPLGALDKALREHMQAEIKSLHRQLGITFIYVTHDQDEALTMSDRIAVFNQGKIAQIGSPGELYQTPSSAFVAGFLGETNLLPVTITSQQGENTVVRLENGCCINATADDLLKPGSQAQLSVRPEDIQLKEHGTGQLTGKISDAVFHGDHWSVQLQIGTNIALRLNVLPEQMRNVNPVIHSLADIELPARCCLILTQ